MSNQASEREALKELAADFALRVATGLAPAAASHPLVGLFCHKNSSDPERTKWGWNYDYQARIHSVVGDVALLQYYDAFLGEPGAIKPVPLSEILGGEWRFYDTHAAWLQAGEDADDRYRDGVHRERDAEFARKGYGPGVRALSISRLGAERLLLLILLRERGWFVRALERVGPGEFQSPVYRSIFEALTADPELQGPVPGMAPESVAELEAMLGDPEVIEHAGQAFQDCLAVLEAQHHGRFVQPGARVP